MATNHPISCTFCGSPLAKPSQYKAFPICEPCYKSAFELDMTVARRLQWEAPSEIIDGFLWLGGEGSTLDAPWLHQHNIRRILTVAAHMDRLPRHVGIEYLQIDVDDDPEEDLKQHWKTAIDCLERAKADKASVLVHCVSGISRSGATVIAYLMKTQRISYKQALEKVRRKRPCVSPNSGFQKQLREFEEAMD